MALIFIGVAANTASSQPPDQLLATRPGMLPIIISAPHGGRKPIPNVPERKGQGVAKFATVRDERTDLIAETVASELEKSLGGKPWLVVAQFDRKYLDVNRPADAAFESPNAKPIYDAYHGFLADACRSVQAKSGRGILLDFHGQAVIPDAICRGTQNGKTVRLLRERFGKPAIVGPQSVLGFLEKAGYTINPACNSDDSEHPQLNGGYIVVNYGSQQGHGIDAIQLELGSKLRTRDAAPKTAKDLAAAIKAYHDKYLK